MEDWQCLYVHPAANFAAAPRRDAHEQVGGGEVVRVKPAGSDSIGGEREIHIEGSGGEQAIIFFGMRSDTDVIYELLDADLSLRRAVTVADFDRDWREHWPQDTASG